MYMAQWHYHLLRPIAPFFSPLFPTFPVVRSAICPSVDCRTKTPIGLRTPTYVVKIM